MRWFKTGVIGWLLANGAWIIFVLAAVIIVTAIMLKERKTVIKFIQGEEV